MLIEPKYGNLVNKVAIAPQDFTSENSTNKYITDAERQYVCRQHASEQYKKMTEEHKREYDRQLGCMMAVIRDEYYNMQCPPITQKKFDELIRKHYEERSK